MLSIRKPPELNLQSSGGLTTGTVKLGGSTRLFIYDCMGNARLKWAKKMF